MRKLILFIATSLDGYIARPTGEVDWLFTDQDYGYTEFFATIDTVLMGRHTYEQLLTFGEYPYAGTQGFVFSQTLQREGDESVQFISEDLIAFVQALKQGPGKNIWLVGGAQVVAACLEANLIDEFIISVHPILLGDGIPLFSPPFPTQTLSLQTHQAFATGLVQLTYNVPQPQNRET